MKKISATTEKAKGPGGSEQGKQGVTPYHF